jgi:Putative peptidoglycan binding domain
MKKLLCFLVVLALAPGIHAGNKKKKNSNQQQQQQGAAAGHKGGGGGHASKGIGGGGGGFGQHAARQTGSVNRSGGMKHKGSNALHGQNAQTGRHQQGGMKHQGSNALGGQQAKTGGHKQGGNPLMQNNRHGSHKQGQMVRQGNKQGHGQNNKFTGNKNGNFKGQHGANARGGKYGRNHVARGYRNGYHGHHGNYHVQPYRQVYHGYHRSYHNRNWYHHHYDRVVLVGGGYYYWNAGYWFPAWGYIPNYSFYAYDGPIYSYDNLPPDEVIVNVQTALQDEGYYTGDIDGQLGPQTRDALATYQQDNDLEVTSAVDEPTVEALGLGS